MLRVLDITDVNKGDKGTPSQEPTEVVDEIELTYDDRYRRRIVLTSRAGHKVLLDLPKARRLAHGDGLVTEDGIYQIIAAPEDLVEVRAKSETHLVQLAWHLGNRHLPVQFLGTEGLRIAWDPVIADMLRGLGAEPEKLEAPFAPEGGAYGHGRTHGHAH